MFRYVARFYYASEPVTRSWRANDAAALSRTPQCFKEPDLVPGQIHGHSGPCPSRAAWRYPRQAKLLQSNRHPRQTERCLKTELYSVQFKDHTLLVLQLCHFAAADNSDACRSRRVGSRDISRGPQIASGPDQIYCGNANSADADATNVQPITLAVEGQGAASAADADNESCLDDFNIDSAGLRPGLRRH